VFGIDEGDFGGEMGGLREGVGRNQIEGGKFKDRID